MKEVGVRPPRKNKAKDPVMEIEIVGKNICQGRRMLDLFSGTGKVEKIFQNEGFDVISVDVDPRWGSTHMVNILEWDYKSVYPSGWFEVIFATPPCDQFSCANVSGKRNLSWADKLVCKVLEIVEYFKPNQWFLENPRRGLLKDRPYMAGIPHVDVDYCQFSRWGYQKPTRIWGG